MRSFLVLVLVGTLGILVGCGSSGTPSGLAVTISLSPTSDSLNAGQTVNIVATVVNDTTNAGVNWSLSGPGTLSGQSSTSVTYTVPATVAGTSLATVVATSVASSSVTASTPIVVSPAGSIANVAPISVNGGPLAPSTIYPNGAFISVLVCSPSSGACQTIPDVLVDTGSYGLRLLASEVTVPLVPLSDTNNNTLYDCISFLDGSYLWGAVAPANIVLGGELSPSTSVQIIANPSFGIPNSCSNNGTGTNEDTQATLGANGILGVGPEPFDCGTACDPAAGGTAPPVYYLCASGGGCSTAFVSCGALCDDSSPNQQVTNPVFSFAADNGGVADNNGVIMVLPAVNDVAPTVNGNLIFGIGTETNNGLGSATVFNLDASDNFITNFGGQAMSASFFDSGSNGYFFPQINSLPNICSDDNSWYCPPSTTAYTATNVGASGTPSNTVNFSVDNYDTVTSMYPSYAAFGNLAGPLACTTSPCSFDWGLPFFYGRNVYTAIDGATEPSGVPAGPFFAY